MSKGNTTENDVLALIFNKTLASHLGTLSGTGNANVYISLHTADPTEAGAQTASEATYGNYGRVAVARTAGGWTVAGNQAKNFAAIQFLTCNGGSNTIKYVAIGTVDYPTAGQILYSGQLNADLEVSNGIQPQFAAEALVVEED
jgi:hypothetical protein